MFLFFSRKNRARWVLTQTNTTILQFTIFTKLPENFEDKLEKFQAFIIAEQKKPKYELSLIGNADQTPLTFDMPSNSMVDS